MGKISEKKMREHYFPKFLKHCYRTLYDCYKDPSSMKRAIWQGYLRQDSVKVLTVLGYSCQVFSLGYLTKKNGNVYLEVNTGYSYGKLLLGSDDLIIIKERGIKWE